MNIEREAAISTLHKSTAHLENGSVFLAAPIKSDNYYSLWTRDSMVTTIGVLQSGDSDLIDTAHNSWSMIKQYQSDLGRIPAYIDLNDPVKPQAEFGGWGRIETLDSQMWYVIGAWQLFEQSQNELYVSPSSLLSYIKAMNILEHRASPTSGLVDWPISAGWDDQMQRRHHVLSLESLRILALDSIAKLGTAAGDESIAEEYTNKANELRTIVQQTFWLDQDKLSWIFSNISITNGPGYFSPHSGRILEFMSEMPTQYFTSYLAPYEISADHLRFDTYANVLSILSGVASDEQAEQILDYISENNLVDPWPVRVLNPVVKPGDDDYHPFYEYGRNKPNQYQNGGIWPHITGLYILALQKVGRNQEAEIILDKMVAMVKQPGHAKTEWGFNEYYHGETGLPGEDAHDDQAWSAGGLLYALSAVAENKKIL